jgi:hypothetical protein
MTEFIVTHTCGHEVRHRYAGPEHQRARREAWLRAKPCQQCWHAQQNQAAAAHSEDLGLPPLQGDAHDVSWAEVIRAKAMKDNIEFHQRVNRAPTGDPQQDELASAVRAATDRALDRLKTEDSAEWWIEHRFDVIAHVRRAAIDAVEQHKNNAD